MRIGPPPLLPLNPIQPDRTVQYPKALGAEFVGNPRLKFPEVKLKSPEPPLARAKDPAGARSAEAPGFTPQVDESKKTEALNVRGALPQLPAPRSTSEPSGPLGTRVDLLA